MAKVLRFIAVAVCLLATGNSLSPLGDLSRSVGNITGAATNNVTAVTGSGGVTDTQSGVLRGLPDTINKLLGSVFQSLQTVIDLLVSELTNVIKVVETTLNTALGAPLDTVNGLLDSLSSTIKPGNIVGGLRAGLGPQLNAVTVLLKQLTGTVGCLVDTGVGNITREVLNGIKETIQCATPFIKEVANATTLIGAIVSDTVSLATTILANITTCATVAAKANSPDFGEIINCITAPVGKSLVEATKVLGKAAPVIQRALKSALEVPQCLQKALNDKIKNVNSMLKAIVNCAAVKGFSLTLTNLPESVPDFKVIAEKAIATINASFAVALDSKSTVATLLERLQKLKDVADKLSPDAIKVSVGKSVKLLQDAIDNLKETGGSMSSGVRQCFSTVQNLLNDLPTKAAQEISACAVGISPEAATFIAEAAELDIGLKTKALEAGVNAFKKCSVFATATDSSAQKCFVITILEVKSYIVNQLKKINNATETASALVKKAEDCPTSGLARLFVAGQVMVAKLKECISEEGMNTPSQDLSTILTAGIKDVEKYASDLSSTLSVLSSVKGKIQDSDEFVSSITYEVLQTLIWPQVVMAKETVGRVAGALADSSNPEVRRCLDTAQNELSQVESPVLQLGEACINKNKVEVGDLTKQVAIEESALKSNLANAGTNAGTKCKGSVSETAAKSCFDNIKIALKAEVNQVKGRLESLVEKSEKIVTGIVSCVDDVSTEATVKVNEDLAMLKFCLTDQGVDVSTLTF